jgi:hypothetical protein
MEEFSSRAVAIGGLSVGTRAGVRRFLSFWHSLVWYTFDCVLMAGTGLDNCNRMT